MSSGERADPTSKDKNGETPLSWAIQGTSKIKILFQYSNTLILSRRTEDTQMVDPRPRVLKGVLLSCCDYLCRCSKPEFVISILQTWLCCSKYTIVIGPQAHNAVEA